MEVNLGRIAIEISLPLRSLSTLLILITFTILSYLFMTKVRRRRVLKFANVYTLRTIHGFKSISPSPLILISKILVVSLLFLVATESIRIMTRSPISDTDICFAIDTSPTMLLPDYKPNRIEFVKSIILKWLDEIPPGVQICIVKFSNKPYPVTTLTNDRIKIERSVSEITVDLNSSGTAIGDAIFEATSILSTSKKKRYLILITDGKNNIGRNLSEAVRVAKEENVNVYVVGIGPTNETIRMFNELKEIAERMNISFTFPEVDEEGLRKVSEETGGEFFYVVDENKFKEAMNKIIVRESMVSLNTDYYILLFISALLGLELILFSVLGAV